MKFKKLFTLIEMLSLTGLISVGFSSWLIVETEFPSISGTIKAENVVNNEFLKIRTMSFSDYDGTTTTPGYYIDFVYNSNRSNTGYLEVVIDIDLKTFKTKVVSTNNYKLLLNLITNSTIPVTGNNVLFYDLMLKEDATNPMTMTYTYTLSTSSTSVTYPTSGSLTPSIIYKPGIEYNSGNVSFTQSSNSLFTSFEIEGSDADQSLTLNLKYSFTLDTTKATADVFFPMLAVKKGITFSMNAAMEGY